MHDQIKNNKLRKRVKSYISKIYRLAEKLRIILNQQIKQTNAFFFASPCTHLNTFASQLLFFEEKMNHFKYNTWVFVWQLTKNFNILMQKLMCQFWCIFKEKWFIFPSKPMRWKAKKLNIDLNKIVIYKYYWIKLIFVCVKKNNYL